MTRKLSGGAVAALIIALFAFGMSLIINKSVFERLPHLEDEFAYLYQAKIFAGGHTWVPRDEPVKVFWQPFLIQPESSPDGIQKRFGKYTPGWPLVLTLGTAVDAPWSVNAFVCMLTVLLIYRMGKEIFDEAVGLVGAALMAISPMALILNATLMSHTSALFFTLLFVYCYWRTTKRHKSLRNLALWGALGGGALGWLVAMRPLTALAMAAPIALHAISNLFDGVFADDDKRIDLKKLIIPMVVMALCVAPMLAVLFGFNYSVTGEVRSELYTLLWEYDKPGFGEGRGLMPGGHSLEYGWRNFNADISIWFRDLFGLTLHPGINDYLKNNFAYGVGIGLSWLLVLMGLVAGRKHEWIWVLFEMFVALVIAQLTYWIGSAVYGSAVYSVRYYYEATGGVVLVAAYGVVAQARAWQKNRTGEKVGGALRQAWDNLWPGYVLFTVMIIVSLVGYLPPRLAEPLRDWPNGLYGFNKVGQYQIDAVNKLREPGKKVLVIVLHDPNPDIEDNWRDYGALMAVTSPYLNSDIIVARLFDTDGLDEFRQRFSDRQVLYEVGEKLYTSVIEAQNAGKDQKPSDPNKPGTTDSSIEM